MSVRYIFPNHPYVGYSLRDPDWVAEHLASGWSISRITIWRDGVATVDTVHIKGPEGSWHMFDRLEDQWLILTEDGVPFDFFESQTDMEVAAQELANFRTGRVTAVHAATAIQNAGKYRFLK